MHAIHSHTDAHANPMTGDMEIAARYDLAIDQLLRYHTDIVDTTTSLVLSPEPAPMALALGAYLHLNSTDRADLETARALHSALRGSTMNEREQGHERAIAAWLDGSWQGAARALDDVLERWPCDMLALIVGHQLDFFLGDAASLRDRPIRMLREIDPEHPHVGFVHGMASFGLEESGHYQQALDAGFTALAAHPEDVWAVHAVTHTYEMEGRVDDGIRFLTSRVGDWGSGNLFTVHNWWHLGLFQLEAGRIDDVLGIYDSHVRHADSAAVPLELLDASAMLWRLHLDGVDSGDRFGNLADAWMASGDVGTGSPSWYVFNDLHAVVALVGDGRLAQARARVGQLAEVAASGGSGSNVTMVARVGLPAARSIVAYGEGRFDDVVGELHPIRRHLHEFGGSHAQRDLLQRTLLDAAIRSGRYEYARALTAERLGMRETGVHSWVQRARALRGLGDATGAASADAEAVRHRAVFAAAAAAASAE